MAGINKVILVGNLGVDPEVRFMPNGNAVANITIATSDTWKDKNTGEKKERTEWHNVVIFGKLAEIAGEYLKKGSKVYIEGQLKTEQYEKDGITKYSTKIVVQGFGGTLQMLDSKGQQSSNQSFNQQQNAQQPAPRSNLTGSQQLAQKRELTQAQQQSQASQQSYANENQIDFDDDIPFAPVGLPFNNSYLYCI